MHSFKEIINAWPSRADLADDLGQHIYTVHKWYSRDTIPAPFWSDLIATGKKRGITITAAQLTEIVKPEPKRRRA